MTTPLAALALLAAETSDKIFATALEVAKFVGLPVDSWRVGDPTRTLFRALGASTAARDQGQAELAKSNFLDTATGDFLRLRASDVYNVQASDATFAAPTVSFANALGGLFEVDVGGLIVQASTTKATYQNQFPVTINPSTPLADVAFIAQVAGSDGTIGEDEIDTIVTPTMQGVTITGSGAAVGADQESDQGVRDACRASLGPLSPNGPADAYESVALNPELTGVDGLSRAKADGDSADGTVSVYIAFQGSAPGVDVVAAVQAATDEWAQPLATDATVIAGSPRTINYTIDLNPDTPSALTVLQTAIDAYHAATRFGAVLARSRIITLAHENIPGLVSVPSVLINSVNADLTLDVNQFPVRGSVTLT